jgi:serine/threonine-protein kinase
VHQPSLAPLGSEDTSWLQQLKAACRTAFSPLRGYAPDVLVVVDNARRERNLRRVQLIAPITLLVHCIMQVRLRLSPVHSVGEAAWREGLVTLQLCAIAFSLWQTYASLWGARWRLVRWYRGMIGDAAWLFYAVFGAALSANAQRFHGGFSAFFATLLLGSTLFQVRGSAAFLGSLTGALTFAFGVYALQPHASIRVSLYFVAFEVPLLALVVSRMGTAAMAREISARLQAERVGTELEALNRDLEQRVEDQVRELKARTAELDAVNSQLNAEVRERSRELSAALERIGDGGELGMLAPKTLLAERFLIQQIVGSGGIGTVYYATDTVTAAPVAIKVLNPGLSHNLEDMKRFLREGEVLASLSHPAIVRTVHVGITSRGRAFLALEYIDGVNFQSFLTRHGRLGAAECARLGAVLADALATAHAARIIHRDVKPSNIMLTSAHEGLKVLDFGLAKPTHGTSAEYTLTGEALGTPAFMAPEQFVDFRSVDDRADVYGLGIVLFVAALATKPFDAVTPHQWMVAHATQQMRTVRSIDADFDGPLAELIESCLQKDPALRPTAAAASAQLSAIADRLGAPTALEIAKQALATEAPSTLPIHSQIV